MTNACHHFKLIRINKYFIILFFLRIILKYYEVIYNLINKLFLFNDVKLVEPILVLFIGVIINVLPLESLSP